MDPHRQRQLETLVKKLGLPAQPTVQWPMLDLALTHSTLSATANYERLEFLGDAALRLTTAEFLLEAYAESPVGELAAIRSVLVSDRTLADLADSYGLDRYLLVANSAHGDLAGARSRLAESFEAVLGALYLSSRDLSLIQPWLVPHLTRLAQEVRADPALQNYKAALQEWTQAHHKVLPEYRTQDVGQAYGDPERFVAEVWLLGQRLASGKGQSIKRAEQAAAEAAYRSLASDGE